MSRFTADDPRHGTPDQPVTKVVGGCYCDTCEQRRTWNRRVNKERRRGRRYTTTPDAAIAHVNTLIAQGWLCEHIAGAAGVGVATLSEIMRGQRAKILTQTADALLAVSGRPTARLINAEPTRRRIRALAALGWPFREIDRRVGRPEGYCRTTVGRHSRIEATAAAAFARVYDELSMTPAPDTPRTRMCRTKAADKGWPPPLAWNDIDDLTEKPYRRKRKHERGPGSSHVDHATIERVLAGDAVPTTRAERVIIMRRWLARGNSESSLCDRMGWQPGRYTGGDDYDEAI